MASIKKIIGSFIHAPDRFDLLADRIAEVKRETEEQHAGLRLRFDEVGDQIDNTQILIGHTEKMIDNLAEQIQERDINWYMDQICDDRTLLSRLNRGLSISPTIWGDPERLEIDETAAVFTCFFNTNSGRIRIGEATFAGSGVSILAGTHNPELTGFLRRDAAETEGCDIEIGKGVWLASGCTILGPCRIGDNAVIAAGAVVTPGTEIMANEIWGGVPARKIGMTEGKKMTPDNPAVAKAFRQSGGILFVSGWGERTPGVLSVPGYRMEKETAELITDRKEWTVEYRKEGIGDCRIRLAGPEGENEITLASSEGKATVVLPVKEGEPGMVTMTREGEGKVFTAWLPADSTEQEAPETEADAAWAAAEEEEIPEGTKLDIEKIMEEIRAEAKKWEPCEDLPAFGNMSKDELWKCSRLREQVKQLTDDYVIPESVDYPSRNPLKKAYKRVTKKAVRCATAPMSARVTETNLHMKTALEKAVEVIEEQEKRINELEKRIRK